MMADSGALCCGGNHCAGHCGTVTPTRRLRACVEAWPDCYTGGYDPTCCRFPKSCSAPRTAPALCRTREDCHAFGGRTCEICGYGDQTAPDWPCPDLRDIASIYLPDTDQGEPR